MRICYKSFLIYLSTWEVVRVDLRVEELTADLARELGRVGVRADGSNFLSLLRIWKVS